LLFVPAPAIPEPAHVVNFAANDASWAWDITALRPPLQGSNVIGSLRFKVPPFAIANDRYEIHFLNADGAPDISTQYSFETFSAAVWVLAPARSAAPMISDEWKAHYFGSWSNPNAADDADPNGDGIPNGMEYRTGVDPTSLHLQILGPEEMGNPDSNAFRIRWFAVEGQQYLLEWTASLGSGVWNMISREDGAGTVREAMDTNAVTTVRFYRMSATPIGR
jgi:hypothetical protein